MDQYQDGASETINGVTYVRQGGVWHAQQSGPVYGPPRVPAAQTPDQAQGQQLQNVHTGLENQNLPLQGENTRVNIQQGQASIEATHNQIKNTNFDNVNNLRKQFESEQPVQDYKTVTPILDAALKAQNNKAGDLNLVYAFGKVMDPNSVVREGEQVMATNVGGVSEKVKGYLDAIQGQGQLTPTQRTELLEEIRTRARSLGQTYDQRRAFYEDFAKRNGINPDDVVGPHPGVPYQQDEAAYVRAHGGTPRNYGTPVPEYPGAPTEGRFGDQTPPSDPRGQPMSDQQDHAMRAWLSANPSATPEQFTSFMKSLGLPGINNPEEVLKAVKSGGRIGAAVYAKPDITDARGGSGIGEKADAFIRGAADTASFGLADKIAALGDTVADPNSTLLENQTREYAISDYDQQNHLPSRLAGQVAGGAMIPFGEMKSIPQIALKSGAAGAAYGAGSSRSLSDVLMNAATGGIAGAAVGGSLAAVGKGIRYLRPKAGEVPPLVNPDTGQMNQPLEAMTPGQRVVTAEEYGVNLPADAAGGRTAAVIGKGLDIMPGSAGVMEDARRGTESQIAAAADVVASRFGSSRTLNEAGSELKKGANQHIAEQKTAINNAYQAIPIPDNTGAALANTRAALERLNTRFQSNPQLAQILRDSKLGAYLSALTQKTDVVPTGILDASGKPLTRTVTHDGELSWRDLKDFRSRVGEMIGDYRFGEGHATSDLRSLYAALSEDMKATAQAQGPGALKAFERANTMNRQNEEMIQGALSRILGPDGHLAPEKAAAAVQAMTSGGKSTGDLKTLAQIRAATVKSGAWNEIAATLIRLGGQPAGSPGRDFNPQTFVQWYANMSEPARAMLFGRSDLRQALNGFVAVNQRLQKVNALRNTSNTAGSVTAAGTVGTMAASLTNPLLGAKLLGVMAGNYGMAKLWTNPAFVRLMTGYSRAVASGNASAVRSQIGRIGKLAVSNPELREPLIALQHRLANDNFTSASAASQPDNRSDNNQQ
jgi:hypothetical protein